jgi:isopentenyldiphosphate isomerase
VNANTLNFSTDNEMLAAVNEKDEVIHSLTRREIHERQLRHRAVHIIVSDSQNRILLQKRSHHKDVHPGAWDTSAAGHVDFGESYLHAAIRELLEELGIRVTSPRNIGRLEASSENGWEFVEIYHVVHDGPFNPNAHEIESLQRLTEEEVETLLHDDNETVTRSFQRVWATYKNQRVP